MTNEHRVTRLEKVCQVGPRAPATHAIVVLDPADYLPDGELPAHVRALIPASVLTVFHGADNGRDPSNPSVSYGGPGWSETIRLNSSPEVTP